MDSLLSVSVSPPSAPSPAEMIAAAAKLDSPMEVCTYGCKVGNGAAQPFVPNLNDVYSAAGKKLHSDKESKDACEKQQLCAQLCEETRSPLSCRPSYPH